MISSNLVPKITLPTRVTHSSATLIDHVFTNCPDTTIAGTLRTDITDHYSNFIYVKTNHRPSTKSPDFITYRPMTDTALKHFNDALYSTDWSSVYAHSNPSLAYDAFLHKYTSLIDLHLPLKTIKFSKYRNKQHPWITGGLLRSLRTKDKLYAKLHKCKCHTSFIEKERYYKKYRNIYNKLIRLSKRMYWHKKFDNCKNDIKRTWDSINEILGRTRNKHAFPQYFIYKDETFNSPKAIAKKFNDYYVNVGPELARKLNYVDPKHFPLPNINLPHSFSMTPVTPLEVARLINRLKPKTSQGYDHISPKFLKTNDVAICDPLAYIANISFQTGIFPQNMKIAKVVPIYKNKDMKLFQNYRPVSLLPCFSKILERLTYNRLYSYLMANKILIPEQYGFQANKSTDMAILELQNLIVSHISNNKISVGLFLDLSKAFDTLDHDILLKKLFHYGIRGVTLDWFRSYLTNRMQFISYKSESSPNLPITCGVPQGSILGPLLFLLYINDISSITSSSKAILFADDTNLIFHDSTATSLEEKTNKEIASIFQWFNANKLSLNTEKTKFIIFRSPHKTSPSINKIAINGKIIERVKSIKFLGVHIDEFLSWETHIDLKNNQVTKNLAVINRIKHNLHSKTLKILYNSLIYPHFTYGVVAWGNTCRKALKRMHLLQKRAVRIVSKSRYNAHTGPLFKKFNILTTHDIYRLSCCTMFWKRSNNKLPSVLHDLISLNNETHNYSTRQSNDIRPASTRNRLDHQCLSNKIAYNFNSLPEFLKGTLNLSLGNFSKKLKDHFVSKYKLICLRPNCPNCQ